MTPAHACHAAGGSASPAIVGSPRAG